MKIKRVKKKAVQEMKTKRVSLYCEDNPYETKEVYIKITGDEIALYEVTSEKAPGGGYGMVHRLDRTNTGKLLQALSAGKNSEIEDLFQSFCGKDAVRRFKEYCETNAIEYTSFLGC